MELPRREAGDVLLPDGSFTQAVQDLRSLDDAHDLNIVIVYAYDRRTHMLPYWYADRRMAPCSVRILGDVLNAAGFHNVRIVLQQWTPNFKPSQATLGGKPIDILMVSAMQVHAEPSYDLVRDAHTLGDRRPLILAGGPKAIYEPADYFELGPKPGISADCVCTGEAYVLLDLLRTTLGARRAGESVRDAFARVRDNGQLKDVPGLVYLPANFDAAEPYAISTGVQRLVRDLDELPMPSAGYRLLEPPHKRATLAPRPWPPRKVGKLSIIASLISTQGCKFNCSYCPIPAVNQRTWRHKSPQRLADEIRYIHENFGIREFFSTDDNFFNNRETVIELMTAMADAKVHGRPLGECISFYTEATQFDVHKNRDILPLCRKGGLRAIWFGIEDITGDLVNKGQEAGNAADLFQELCALGIQPMAMMMHSDDQPLHSPRGDLAGLVNQAKYLFDKGAVSYQCTYLGPAIGTREIETAVQAGSLYESIDGEPIPQAFFDGNHVVASNHPDPHSRQMNVVRAYATFYNPWNALRVLLRGRKQGMLGKRLLFQLIGQIGLVLTAPKLIRWARTIRHGTIRQYKGLITARI
ncbi:MAG TPA: radical SAM protein, partial [Phycisphaerae bacterium]|nr:radical SAM protein [Phycisphaerae bacterium]